MLSITPIIERREYQPYTYLIRFVPTGQQYYGVQFAKGARPENLWVTYFTSSKVVKRLIAEHGKDAFEIVHTTIHVTKEEAMAYEEKFLIGVDAGCSDEWLNKSNGAKNFCVTEESSKKSAVALKATLAKNPEIVKQRNLAYRAKLLANPELIEQRVAKFKATLLKKHEIRQKMELTRQSTLAANTEIVKHRTATRQAIYTTNPEILKQIAVTLKVTSDSNPYNMKKAGENFAKSYTIVFPDGIVKVIKNLSRFCRELYEESGIKLANGALINVAKGKAPAHKGFKCSYYRDLILG